MSVRVMVRRHFAFFDGEGACVREWAGPVPEPDIDPRLVGPEREVALNAWATAVSQPAPGEVGLDVTHVGAEVGAFCWAHFDRIDRVLSFPERHRFVQIDKVTGRVSTVMESGMPVESNERHDVIDVTNVETCLPAMARLLSEPAADLALITHVEIRVPVGAT